MSAHRITVSSGTLLAPLLQVADIRWDIIGEIGTFYSDLLDRRGAVVFESIEKLPADRQKLVCKLAYEDDLSIDSPKPDRVITFLKRLARIIREGEEI
jgi:hypothetical protein